MPAPEEMKKAGQRKLVIGSASIVAGVVIGLFTQLIPGVVLWGLMWVVAIVCVGTGLILLAIAEAPIKHLILVSIGEVVLLILLIPVGGAMLVWLLMWPVAYGLALLWHNASK